MPTITNTESTNTERTTAPQKTSYWLLSLARRSERLSKSSPFIADYFRRITDIANCELALEQTDSGQLKPSRSVLIAIALYPLIASLSLLLEFFTACYRYREYLIQSVARDLRKKYKRSVLGYFWSMLHPLIMMSILSVVFSKLMNKHIDNYPVFLFSAMIGWSYFDSTVGGCLGVIRSNARILDQIAVPKFIFLVSVALYNLVNFFLSLVPLFAIMLITNASIHPSIFLLPIVLVPLCLYSIGVASFFAVSNVFFEDTQHLSSVILRALYFLCPIIISRKMLPEWLLPWVKLNPLFGLLEALRGIIYYGAIPDYLTLVLNTTGALIVLLFGLWIFRKTNDKFIYYL